MIEIKDEKGRTLFAFAVPDMGERQLTVTQNGEPLVGIEVTAGGGLRVGHWPDGETWQTVLIYPAYRD